MALAVAEALGHVFADPRLHRRALTHRSAAVEHNERLEFLGDGLLNMIVAEALYQRFPLADEGWLSRARAQLVCEAALARIARDKRLGAQLHLGAGELKVGGDQRDSILADALEAVIGAIHLDAGFDVCRRAVLAAVGPSLAQLADAGIQKDAKTRLQEWLQAQGFPLPSYVLIEARGEDHDKTFIVECSVSEPVLQARGVGHSRRQAEQQAAQAVFEQLAPR
ncbi:MAG: ribonuclease III [Xanthomonadales bacterium]|nr:ribonuclease III [Xanthomonadales bacterium]